MCRILTQPTNHTSSQASKHTQTGKNPKAYSSKEFVPLRMSDKTLTRGWKSQPHDADAIEWKTAPSIDGRSQCYVLQSRKVTRMRFPSQRQRGSMIKFQFCKLIKVGLSLVFVSTQWLSWVRVCTIHVSSEWVWHITELLGWLHSFYCILKFQFGLGWSKDSCHQIPMKGHYDAKIIQSSFVAHIKNCIFLKERTYDF